MDYPSDGSSALLNMTIDHFTTFTNRFGKVVPVTYTLKEDSICETMWSQHDSAGITIGFNMVLEKNGANYLYNQRLELYPARYADTMLYTRNVSVTSNEKMADLWLPDTARVKGYGSFPTHILYRNSSALPVGVVLDPETGASMRAPCVFLCVVWVQCIGLLLG